MQFIDTVNTRRMVRSYNPDRQVERSTVEMLIKLAIRAPSAGHTQGWRFLVLDDITSRSRFWSAASTGPSDAWRERMTQAPVLIVCFADRDAYIERYRQADKAARSIDSSDDRDPTRWPVPYWDVDTGMAALLLLLGAHDAGLGAAFFGVPGSRWAGLAQAFHVPDGLRPIGVVSLGYPAPPATSPGSSRRRPRRGLDEVVAFGSFG